MNSISKTFVIIHIRISRFKVFGISTRNIITLCLVLLLMISLFRLLMHEDFVEFIVSMLYMVLIFIGIYYWLTTWVEANRYLNNSVDTSNSDKMDQDNNV